MNQDEPKKFQVQSLPTKRISVNDALTHDLFSMTDDEYDALMDGDERTFLEAAKSKHGKIESRYWLDVLDDSCVDVSRRLDEYDRDILDACLSSQNAGNRCATSAVIWRGITGDKDARLTPAEKKKIMERVNRLACTRITVDISDAQDAKIYPAGMTYKIKSTLLPCDIVTAELNGQIVDDLIYFNAESPLLRLARARTGKKGQKQILTYESALLNVPNQRCTPTTTKITNYIVRRVEAAKQHHMARTILLSTIARNCALEAADRRRQHEYRKTIENVMKSLVEKGEISSFEVVKEQGKYTKITFNFNAECSDDS